MNRLEWEEALSKCSPECMTAWLASLALTPDELRTGPGAGVAGVLGIHRKNGAAHVARLVKVGVLVRTAGHGVAHVRLPRGGVLLGGWDRDRAVDKMVETVLLVTPFVTGWGLGGGRYIVDATGRNYCIFDVAKVPTVVVTSLLYRTSSRAGGTTAPAASAMPPLGYVEPDDSDEAGPRPFSPALEALAPKHLNPARPKPLLPASPLKARRKVDIDPAEHLKALYMVLRAPHDPGFTAGPVLHGRCQELALLLRQRRVSPELWPQFMEYVFDGFKRMTGNPVAPVRVLTSDHFVEGFVATLGKRRYDGRHAEAMLTGAGFDCSKLLAVAVVEIAVRYKDRELGPDDWVDPEYWAAVLWMRPRLGRLKLADAVVPPLPKRRKRSRKGYSTPD